MTIETFYDVLNHLFALTAIAASALLTYGYLRLSLTCTGLIRHLAAGLLLMHLVVLLRTFYWEVLAQMDTGIGFWMISEMPAGGIVHILFNCLVVAAAYHSLKALWLAIPAQVRSDYSLIEAAFYPRMRIVRRIGALLAQLRSGRGADGP